MVEVKQYYLGCLAQASYMLVSQGQAFVIDPRRDIDIYLKDIQDQGLKVVGVMLTHLHADFVAGHLDLARATGAPVYVGQKAEVGYPHIPLTDGLTLEFGQARLEFMETPGHTPGDIATLLFDQEHSESAPLAVFTGDTLFIGDVGRPDLLASAGIAAHDLAAMLYRSLQKLLALPDATLLYPGHGAGSLCGKNLSSETVSTIGAQRKTNYALQARSAEEFIALVTANQLAAPAYFSRDVQINKLGPQVSVSELTHRLQALPYPEFAHLLDQSHLVRLDTRSGEEFAAGFIPGFINISLDGQFATWVGSLLEMDAPIIFVAPVGREEETATRLARVGFDHAIGYLQGGFQRWVEHKGTTDMLQRLEPAQAMERVAAGQAQILDVRNEGERLDKGLIPQARAIPLAALPSQVGTLDPAQPWLVHCAGGYRSMIAASLLKARGFSQVMDLHGGFSAWRDAGLPVAGL